MLIDAHAHLDRYGAEIEDALEEIRAGDILTVSNSMDVPSYQRNLEIAGACDLVLPVLGVHPWNAPEHVDRLEELEPLIAQTPMIGEIGLDHFFVKDRSRYPAQRRVFEFFLAAAQRQNKIVNVHTKGAEEDILALLADYAVERAVVHWYSGAVDTFRRLADRGVYFTIGVEVLYSAHIRDIARAAPPNQLLTETDNPGGPRSFLGKPGMPLLIKDVVREIAALRGPTYDEVVHQTQQNFLRLIRDDPGLADLHNRLVKRNPGDKGGETKQIRSMDDQTQPVSRLIIVCGLSFAGKTTLGNAICAQFGHPQVDVDETKVDLYGPGIDDRDLSREQWTEIYRQTDARIVRHLRNGDSVVDASRNFRRDERDAARDIAKSVGAEVAVVYVNTPESAVRQRWLENRASQARRDVSDEDFEEIIAVMQPPSADEKAMVFHHDDDIRNWLAEHAQWLGP